MIFLECNPDEALVMTLGITRKEVRHEDDKGEVCKKVARNSSVKGLIEEDPEIAQPKYIRGLELKEEKHQIKLFYDRKTDNSIIMICPKLETWIILVCQRAKLDITKFGLPDKPNQLHKVLNTRIAQWKTLLTYLESHENESILYLKSLLNS